MMPLSYGWGALGWILTAVFWILVVLGIIFVVRGGWRPDRKEDAETALDILNKRYARGEINKEEFEEKKKDLTI